jgi:hypothetical protein
MTMKLIAITAGAVAVSAAVSGTNTGDNTLTPNLVTMKETRLSTTVAEEDRSPFDVPSFEVTFEVPVPAGKQLLAVAEPTSITARDSVGADLADIEPTWGDQVTFVEMVHSWEGPSTQFKLTLDPATRQAGTFSLNAQLDATFFESTEQQSLTLTGDWSAINPKVFGVPVTAKLTTQGEQTSLEFKPGSVRDQIESVELVGGAEPVTQDWSMWNEDAVTYAFSNAPTDAAVRLMVRRGLETRAMRIQLLDQPLP